MSLKIASILIFLLFFLATVNELTSSLEESKEEFRVLKKKNASQVKVRSHSAYKLSPNFLFFMFHFVCYHFLDLASFQLCVSCFLFLGLTKTTTTNN